MTKVTQMARKVKRNFTVIVSHFMWSGMSLIQYRLWLWKIKNSHCNPRAIVKENTRGIDKKTDKKVKIEYEKY